MLKYTANQLARSATIPPSFSYENATSLYTRGGGCGAFLKYVAGGDLLPKLTSAKVWLSQNFRLLTEVSAFAEVAVICHGFGFCLGFGFCHGSLV